MTYPKKRLLLIVILLGSFQVMYCQGRLYILALEWHQFPSKEVKAETKAPELYKDQSLYALVAKTVFKLHPKTGQVYWKTPIKRSQAGTVPPGNNAPRELKVIQGRVYVLDTSLICLDSLSGKILWELKPDSGHKMFSKLESDGESLYVISHFGFRLLPSKSAWGC